MITLTPLKHTFGSYRAVGVPHILSKAAAIFSLLGLFCG